MHNKELHIAVNARFLLKNKLEGLGRFSDEILKRLVLQHPEVKFSFFFDRKFDSQFIYGPNVTGYVLNPPARHPILWKIWFEFSVKRMLNKLKPDIFFSPDGFLCLGSEVPQVPVIHDLAFEHFPQDTMRSHAKYYKKFFPRFAKKARKILTVSEFTKNDLVKRYGTEPAKISVAWNAASNDFHPADEISQIQLREKFTNGKPFFHYAGAIQPRKNIPSLIRAFEIFKSESQSEAKLLLVGRMAWKFEEVNLAIQNSPFKNDIVLTGFVSDKDLIAMYGSSLALCYLPFFEGFGIPLVEAMRCGCPIITSDQSSLPEVAGDAALFSNPKDEKTIAGHMMRIAGNPEVRMAMRKRGLERSLLFDWDKSAEKIWQAMINL